MSVQHVHISGTVLSLNITIGNPAVFPLLKELSVNLQEALAKLTELQTAQADTLTLVGKVSTDVTTLLTKIDELSQVDTGELPEEVATLVVMLSSKRTANVTGANFVIDGGLIKTT